MGLKNGRDSCIRKRIAMCDTILPRNDKSSMQNNRYLLPVDLSSDHKEGESTQS